MIIEIVTHPGTGIFVGWVACTCAGRALDVIKRRVAEERRKPWEDPTNREELELWHATWVSPSISDTFYTWDDERGFVEREPWSVVHNILRWSSRPRPVRADFSEMLGEPGSGLWSRMLAYRVREYGIWNALDYLDKETERHEEAARKALDNARESAARVKEAEQRRFERIRDLKVAEFKRKEAWGKSGKCRVCAGIRRGFSRDYCAECWSEMHNTYSTHRKSFLPGLPEYYTERVPTDEDLDIVLEVDPVTDTPKPVVRLREGSHYPRQKYATTSEDDYEYSSAVHRMWMLHGVQEVGVLDKDRNHVRSLQRRTEDRILQKCNSILEEIEGES